MSNRVSIPIGVDATRAVSEMERFTGAIRKTGQEGRKFAELDFSHPEMAEFAETMAEAQKRFDEIVAAGRGATARGLRSGVAAGKFSDIVEWWNFVPNDPRLQDPRVRKHHSASVLSGLFSGTPLQPSVPGQQPPQPPGGGGGLPAAVGGSITSMMRWALPVLGIAGVGALAKQGITTATDEAVEVSALRRSMGNLTTDFETFRSQIRQAGEGLGLTYQETVKLAKAFTQASGDSNSQTAFRDTRQAVGFARAFGMDPSQTVGRFGRAQWLQVGGKEGGAKEIAALFADAIEAGGMFSKGDEVMDAIVNWVAASERIMVNAPNVKDFAALQASMNRSGAPGLQGEAGATILNQIDSSIRSGGAAGEAGQNFLYRILSGTGVRDPFDVQYQLEEGAFSRLSNGKTVFESVRDALKEQYTDPKMRASAGARLLGLTMHQYERLEDLTPADIGGTERKLGQLGLDLGDVDAESYLDVAKLNRMKPTELRQYRDQLISARGDELTQDQRAALETRDTEKLREALISTVAAIGPEKDIGRRSLDVQVEIKNQVTRIADGLLKPIETTKSAIGTGLEAVGDVTDEVGDVIDMMGADTEEERKKIQERREASGNYTLPPELTMESMPVGNPYEDLIKKIRADKEAASRAAEIQPVPRMVDTVLPQVRPAPTEPALGFKTAADAEPPATPVPRMADTGQPQKPPVSTEPALDFRKSETVVIQHEKGADSGIGQDRQNSQQEQPIRVQVEPTAENTPVPRMVDTGQPQDEKRPATRFRDTKLSEQSPKPSDSEPALDFRKRKQPAETLDDGAPVMDFRSRPVSPKAVDPVVPPAESRRIAPGEVPSETAPRLGREDVRFDVKFDPIEVHHKNEKGEVISRQQITPRALRKPAEAH